MLKPTYIRSYDEILGMVARTRATRPRACKLRDSVAIGRCIIHIPLMRNRAAVTPASVLQINTPGLR